ncbi:two-component regulator propeller domain-containing protein [Portibacter marinus]|uniref:two-component regulator propeller domain-containing protein n=1 Tax=Portibacter marinus TaxID=2898660 RepID=UPI001F3FA90B|nr:two-component regulator propeller domain-containing protein [Portibacter marinus]
MNNCKTNLSLVRGLLLLAWTCWSVVLVAQDATYFKKLGRQDGLSQSSVFAITEDTDGFLWFGTRDGLNKYDGYNFTIFRKGDSDNGPVGNDVRSLYTDPFENLLWIGTLEGLSYLDLDTYTFTSFRHEVDNLSGLASNHISCIYRKGENQVWVGTSKGLNEYNPVTSQFKLYRNTDASNTNTITHILDMGPSTFWIGTRNGLYSFDLNTKGFAKIDLGESLNQSIITAMVRNVDGTIWLGTDQFGIIQLDSEGKILKHLKSNSEVSNTLGSNIIRSLCFDAPNRLWIGTFDGLNLLDTKTEEMTLYKSDRSLKNALTDNSIKALYADRKGSMWIGTYYGGVNHLDEGYNQFKNYTYSPYHQGLSAPVVSSFAEDQNGDLWIGTEGGGLNFYDVNLQTYKHFVPDDHSNTIAGSNVKQLLLDGDDLWIGHFSSGLDKFNIKTQTFENLGLEEGLSNDNVYDLLIQDAKIWIATYAGGLNIYDKATGEVVIYQHNDLDSLSVSSDFIRVLFRSSSDEIWLGTARGLNQIEVDGNGLPFVFKRYLEDIKIYSIQEDNKGNLWLGTISNGLIKWNPKTLESKSYSTFDGLAGNTVFGIIEDEKGYLWLSTNNGISRFCKDDEQFINFNNANGLTNSEFNFNAYYRTANGDIIFGGVNGYTRFDPQQIIINDFEPPVVFTGITQNNRPLKLEHNINEIEKVLFKYNQANFTINFAALDYSNPDNNYYSYKLEGLDQEWITSIGQPSATYTIQRHGTYTFLLKGGNSAGKWNDEVKKLEIEVLPPPWRTWWAYLLYILIGIAGIYAILRYLRLRDSYQFELKEKLQKEELHRLKLNFFTNVAHEFRTPLTLIIGPIEDLIKNLKSYDYEALKDKLLKINSNSQRMLNLVNQLMTFRKMEAGHEPMKVTEVQLKPYLSKIYGLFEDHANLMDINYKLILPNDDLKVWIDEEKIEKVLFNLLSNAFKFTPHQGEIILSILEEQTKVMVVVQDSGEGIPKHLHNQIFQRFYEKNPGETSNLIKGTGIGLALSKELVELHKGRLDVESKEGNGARFIVNLQKGKSHFSSKEIVEVRQFEAIAKPTEIVLPSEATEERSIISESTLKLLVVDDNREVLDYITSIFDGKYKIVIASDGKEGLMKSREYQPDLIISDVMMPEMDGITFCNEIRSDLSTSHIPLILLTARTLLDDKLEGLKSGANDFISKPFHPDELRYKVENLLAQQKMIKEALADKAFNPKDLEITSADEQFLQNLLKLVETNIDNPEFKIEQFAHELAVSRALLFTKIKAMTDMTPKNFLKSFRMKRAIQLLETGKLNVHEVAFMVGYKDPKYFSKVFQKEFGKNPSEYTVAFRV